MTAKHTPAPWIHKNGIITSEKHNTLVAEVTKKNAILIAAAPDLLEALTSCLDLFDALVTSDFDCILKARAAIEKATK